MKIDYVRFLVACARLRTGVTAICKKAGCTPAVIVTIRKGRNVRPTTAEKLANALDVDVMELLALD